MNDDVTAQDMTGWRLHDEAENRSPFVFPSGYQLPAGHYVKVWSYGVGPDSEFDIDWTKSAVWNNDGDMAFLYDDAGHLVAQRSC